MHRLRAMIPHEHIQRTWSGDLSIFQVTQVCLFYILKNLFYLTISIQLHVAKKSIYDNSIREIHVFIGRNQLIAVVGLALNSQLVGNNHIVFYLDYVIKQAGVSSEASGWVTAGLLVVPAVAAISGVSF